MINPRRATTIAAFVAIVVVALVLRDPSDPDDSSSPPAPSLSATTVPLEVPTEQFCAAFEAMAAAHSNHLANDTPESLAEVTAAGEAVLELAPGTAMSPAAREGLEYFVDGVIGRESEPVSTEAQNAFTQFVEVACRPGG